MDKLTESLLQALLHVLVYKVQYFRTPVKYQILQKKVSVSLTF